MYVVIRSSSGQGATELFDLLGQREADVRELIGGVPGFDPPSTTEGSTIIQF